MFFKKVVDIFVPAYAGSDPEVHLSRRLYVFTTLSVALLTLFFAVSYLAYGMMVIAFAQFLISLTAVFGYFLFKKTGHYHLPLHVLLFVTWIASIFRVYYMGGISAPTFYTYVIIPVYAGAIFTASTAVVWTLLFCAVPLVFHFIENQGVAIDNHISKEGLASARIWGIVISNIIVLVVMISVKGIFKKFRRLVEIERDEKAGLLKLFSHDISNPLAVMNISLNQIRKNKQDPEYVEKAIKRCESAVFKISQIVDNIKKIEAMKSGKVKLQNTLTSVFEICDQIEEYTFPLLQEKQISLRMVKPEQDISIFCDSELIQTQIVGNLLSNAIKFSVNESTVELTVKVLGDRLLIEVKDSGKGISQKDLPFIFSADRPTTSLGTAGERGTGFGLPIVMSVIEILGGNIQVESRSAVDGFDKTGTIFKINIPVRLK